MRFLVAIESGPRQLKSMIHVLDLPGTVLVGPTTAAALESTPAAIRERIAFLRGYGDPIPDPEPIDIEVAEHDTSGDWLGFAVRTFDHDLQPLARPEAERQIRWVEWSREALIGAARSVPGDPAVKPPVRGRSIIAILAHVADAERGYVTSVLGSVPGLNAALKAVEAGAAAGIPPWDAIAAARSLLIDRLAAMTDAELELVVQRGTEVRSTRRMLRRTLEHEWEHTLELRGRVATPS